MADNHVMIIMPPEMVERLDEEAIRRNISRSALIREACAEKLASLPKRRRKRT